MGASRSFSAPASVLRAPERLEVARGCTWFNCPVSAPNAANGPDDAVPPCGGMAPRMRVVRDDTVVWSVDFPEPRRAPTCPSGASAASDSPRTSARNRAKSEPASPSSPSTSDSTSLIFGDSVSCSTAAMSSDLASVTATATASSAAPSPVRAPSSSALRPSTFPRRVSSAAVSSVESASVADSSAAVVPPSAASKDLLTFWMPPRTSMLMRPLAASTSMERSALGVTATAVSSSLSSNFTSPSEKVIVWTSFPCVRLTVRTGLLPV